VSTLPDFSAARVLVAGDGEALRFGDALNGIACNAERLAACGKAAHGARPLRP
jgi:hypothetical protein